MYETARDTRDEELVVDEELNGAVELLAAALKHGVELLRLRNGTRETVKNETRERKTRQKKNASVTHVE